MKLKKLFLFALLLMSFVSVAQPVPQVDPKTGGIQSMAGVKGWLHPDSGAIDPWTNAKKSPAGVQFNLPGRRWFDRWGDSSFHGFDGVREFRFLTEKDTPFIKSFIAAGSVGPQGPAGANGSNGIDGKTWYSGTGVPSSGTGVDGDFYFKTSSADIYKKASGAWGIIANITGPAGATGGTGAAGSNGTNGTNGTNGATWSSGSGVPSGGASGDYYLRTSNGDVYKNTSGTWNVIANIIGPTGATGATGAAGSNGSNGTNGTNGSNGTNGFTWYSGSGVPSNGTGVNGDYDLNTANGDVYNKAAGSWGSPIGNLTGPTGATGATGSTGPAGPNNITTATTTNGTGFMKGNGSNVSFDNSTYLTTAVTSVTVNSVTPLFTTSTSNNTTTPSTTFTLIQQTQNKIYASPNGSTGDPSFRPMVAADVPTLNQNTTGSAAKWTTPRSLGGNSVDGSADVPFTNKFLVQGTSDAGLSNAQFMGALGTGIVKNTTTTGVQSIATAGTDYQLPVTWTGVKTSNYSAAAYDAVPVDCSTVSVTVTLPTAPANNTRVWVKCVAIASTFSVTVSCGGSDVLNVAGGSASGTLIYLNEGAIFHYKASTGIWYVLHSIPRTAFGTNAFTSTSYVAATTTLVNTVPLTSAANNTITVPVSTGVTGLGTGVATALATPSSANIASACSDETGTGALVFANKPTFIGTIHTIVTVSAQAFDGSLGGIYNRTLAASETFTQSNFNTGQPFIVKVKQGSGTSYTVTWWSGITWITTGSTAPTQTTTSNGYTSYGFICTGTNTFDGYLLGSQ